MVKLYNNAHVLTNCQKDSGGGGCRCAAAVAEATATAATGQESGGSPPAKGKAEAAAPFMMFPTFVLDVYWGGMLEEQDCNPIYFPRIAPQFTSPGSISGCNPDKPILPGSKSGCNPGKAILPGSKWVCNLKLQDFAFTIDYQPACIIMTNLVL